VSPKPKSLTSFFFCFHRSSPTLRPHQTLAKQTRARPPFRSFSFSPFLPRSPFLITFAWTPPRPAPAPFFYIRSGDQHPPQFRPPPDSFEPRLPCFDLPPPLLVQKLRFFSVKFHSVGVVLTAPYARPFMPQPALPLASLGFHNILFLRCLFREYYGWLDGKAEAVLKQAEQ